MHPRPLLLLALLLPAACRSTKGAHNTGDDAGSGGKLTAAWVGADTGKLTARPRAVFCAGESRLELTATNGDAGVGLAIYPDSELAAGTYDGFDPGVDSIRRPGVTGAARWFTERAIEAYQSDWGSLQLTRNGASISGDFALHMRKLGEEKDSIILNGRFSGVTPGACQVDSVSPPAPAQ
jgi:uncharacterized protein involved in copper resistance